jgi:hypothetical protein
MKTLIIATFSAACLHAGFLSQPDILHDGLAVDPTAKEWGAEIIAIPNVVYFVGFNDNWGNDYPGMEFGGPCGAGGRGCDLDGNDAVLTATFSADASSYLLRYFLSISADTNYVVPLGSAEFLAVGQSGIYPSRPGDEAVFWLIDKTTGKSIFTGPADRNWDGVLQHAFVTTVTTVPEPKAWMLVAGGLLLLWLAGLLAKRRRTR